MSRHLILPATVVAATIMALLCTATTPTAPMTEAEAIAERDRLQKIHTYMRTVWGKKIQEIITAKETNGAAWTAAGCGASYTGCTTTMNAACCEGPGPAPYVKKTECEDCALICGDKTHTNYAAECTPAGFEGSSVCGTDSTGAEIPAWPMVRSKCSTGPTHEIDGFWEESNPPNNKFPTPVSSFYTDMNADNQDTAKLGVWSKNVLSSAILTNAATATKRATVTFEPEAELVIATQSRNNGLLIVNGSWKTHFIAIDPINYGNGSAYGDGMSVLGGDLVLLGATSYGSLNSTTNGTARMHNVVSSGNVNSKGSTDMFMSNVRSSGNVMAEATSSTDKRVLYNVTATAGTITVVGGLSAIYSVEAHTGVVMSVTGGAHFISNTSNAGSLSVTGCTYVNMYNVINTGTVNAACTTVYGRQLENSGTVTFTSGDLDIEIVANTGTVVVSSGVTGVISAPTGTSINAPSTVTVTYTGTAAATAAGSQGTQGSTSSGSSKSAVSGSTTTSGSTSGASAVTFFAAAFLALIAMML